MGVSWREHEEEKARKLGRKGYKAYCEKPGPPNSEEQERESLKHAFFSKRRKGFPTKAQLANMRRLF